MPVPTGQSSVVFAAQLHIFIARRSKSRNVPIVTLAKWVQTRFRRKKSSYTGVIGSSLSHLVHGFNDETHLQITTKDS